MVVGVIGLAGGGGAGVCRDETGAVLLGAVVLGAGRLDELDGALGGVVGRWAVVECPPRESSSAVTPPTMAAAAATASQRRRTRRRGGAAGANSAVAAGRFGVVGPRPAAGTVGA